MGEADFIRWMQLQGYTRRLEDLGERRSWVFIGPEWANATASGALYKFTTGEGGVRVPLIVAGPGVTPQRIDARTFVTDIAPTLLERAGVTAPAPTLDGVSINALLSGAAAHVRDADAAIGIEVSGHAALYRGDYKLVRTPPPLGDNAWRLYDVTRDPGETHDLSAAMPDLAAAMLAEYDAYAARNGVLALPEGYDVQRQVIHNVRMKQLEHYWWVLALAALALIGLVVAAVWLLRRRRRPKAA
jgi:arylsulfatase/uncharacterized sulfatase